MDENSNLTIVSYSPTDGMCCLIPLWYLAADEDRRNALKTYIDQYTEEHSDTTENNLSIYFFVADKNFSSEGCAQNVISSFMVLKNFSG